MKWTLGVLALLTGVAFVVVGIWLVIGMWGCILEVHGGWWLYALTGLIGLVPTGFGGFVCFVSWVLFRGSRTLSE